MKSLFTPAALTFAVVVAANSSCHGASRVMEAVRRGAWVAKVAAVTPGALLFALAWKGRPDVRHLHGTCWRRDDMHLPDGTTVPRTVVGHETREAAQACTDCEFNRRTPRLYSGPSL